ncbi:MAG: cysteine rich repeat-containing protein [Xanthobacteraceae bacterium]|nr:cysteine rich repeat-containing protein [Xanthobacteraceae bacterium]GIK99058.1 MAG: hypothetical protein BroJett029_32670 [Alphaproteobacteria bacterium]
MTRFAISFVMFCILSGNVMAQSTPPALPSIFSGTPEEQRACRRDATRLCSEQIPDNLAVLACLQRNRAKLHKACLKVLETHGR